MAKCKLYQLICRNKIIENNYRSQSIDNENILVMQFDYLETGPIIHQSNFMKNNR